MPFRELPFEQIPDEVASGRADYGLLIHEGQLTFSDLGLHKVLDLGEWWLLETGLPLPLGVNVVRRDVERVGELSEVLGEAIRCGLENRDEALEYALQFGRGIDEAVADRFIEMYVNELTEDYGEEGRAAVPSYCAAARRSARSRGPSSSTSCEGRRRSRFPLVRGLQPLSRVQSSRKTISCAPSQRNLTPSGRRFSFPSTTVAKWFPASWPALEAKLT